MVEAAWRAVYFLVRRLDTDSGLKLCLLDVSKEELAADLAAVKDLRDSADTAIGNIEGKIRGFIQANPRVTVKIGKRTLVGEVRSGSSYDSNSDIRVHFGLGDTTTVAAIHVRWPDGLAEVFDGGPVDRVRVLRRGEGTAEPATREKSP